MNIERTRAICPRSSICRNQKLKGTCISYIVNNDLFSIVHNIWIYVYITKRYMYVSSEKSVYISEENGAILNFFFCCLHHGVVLWSSSWKGFTAAYISGEVFSLFLKMFTWNHVHVLECVHYTYTCTCTCLYTCTWSLQHAWNIRHLQNVSDKIMFTAFLKNKGNVWIRTFGFKLN